MESVIPPMIFMLIVGGVTGYFAGHLVKRVRGMALTIGVIAFVVIVLAYTGNLNLNFDAIASNISRRYCPVRDCSSGVQCSFRS